MSFTHDIDNDEGLFPFDAYEPLKVVSLLKDTSRESRIDSVSSCRDHITALHPDPNRMSDYYQDHPSSGSMQEVAIPDPKGKGISHPSEPMPIITRAVLDNELDLFAMSFGSAGSSSRVVDPALALSFYTPQMEDFHSEIVELDDNDEPMSSSSSKGKARELPPSIPPLSFTPTEFSYGSPEWPSITGSSSYGSNYSGAAEPEPSSAISSSDTGVLGSPPSSPVQVEVPHCSLLRAHSLSNLSTRSRRSLSNVSISKVKLKLGASPPSSPLSTSPDIDHDTTTEVILANSQMLEQRGGFLRWTKDPRPRTPLASPVVETDAVWGTLHTVPRSPRPNDPYPLRTKGRSYSSPLPLPPSVFDIVPLAPADIFAPPPIITPCYFDHWLPRELKLQVFRTLVQLHEAEHEKRLTNGKWTAIKAGSSRNRWTGREKGLRELFKMSRVCRSWQILVFDGQLWAKLDLRSFPNLSSTSLSRISRIAGGFIKDLDLSGHADLLPSTLLELTEQLCGSPPTLGINPHTQLTTINLQGCSHLTTRSLHNILLRSPFLQKLCLKGLTAVTNTTCDVLAIYCPHLVSLNMSRCPNMTGEGVLSVASAAVRRGEHMHLKELRLAGLKRVTDAMMAALGRAAPLLEVLDLSGARDLHNSAIDAFVACTEADSAHLQCVQLTSREAGRDPSDYTSRYWRRVTHLRHLNLSSCILLTDHACSHLAHAVPKLEFLELASIGPELRDDGLIRLLNTTPFIRRIDLEDATEISDDLLLAVTPSQVQVSSSSPPLSLSSRPSPPPEPGHALEQLIISYANINNEALMELVRNCTHLRILEADNTRMSGLVLREFVELAQSRKIADARIVAVDCRGIGEYAVKELTERTRPRLGWRSWHAGELAYLDGRDEEGLNVGQDECDENKVVVKTFYSWQTVDAVQAARKKRKPGSKRGMNSSRNGSASSDALSSSGRARWWSPSGRRSSGPNTPTLLDMNGDRDGCTIM
ncbi:unnamed protein product [Somion occarium]|uniref:F-box domain-containing protein n=1 Tax=Somion occarium TaxID=3059160 RepID=A0ABP1CFI3_9APHY